MAWKRYGRRRRPKTRWFATNPTLSRVSQEAPVQGAALRNLQVAASPTGTLAALPQDLFKFIDNETGATGLHINEGGVERRTLLRLVGMFRPIRVGVGDAQSITKVSLMAEVRYAIYRGNTSEDEADYDEGGAAPNIGFADQPDLWLSSHLGNERIAFFRSFLLPLMSEPVQEDYSVTDVVNLDQRLVDLLPWWYDAALTVIDLKSRRGVNTDSKLYLLRQARLASAGPIGPAEQFQQATLYHADFARMLGR